VVKRSPVSDLASPLGIARPDAYVERPPVSRSSAPIVPVEESKSPAAALFPVVKYRVSPSRTKPPGDSTPDTRVPRSPLGATLRRAPGPIGDVSETIIEPRPSNSRFSSIPNPDATVLTDHGVHALDACAAGAAAIDAPQSNAAVKIARDFIRRPRRCPG
jgi:hypothetical protein